MVWWWNQTRLTRAKNGESCGCRIENTAQVIKNTGIFDKVDRIYGDIEVAKEGGQPEGEEAEGGGDAGGGGGGFGGGGFGEEDIDFGEEDLGGGDEGGDIDFGGDEGGGDETAADVGAELETTEESIKNAENLLNEQKSLLQGKNIVRKAKRTKTYMERLNESIVNDEKPSIIREKIYDKNLTINDSINEMIQDINGHIDDIEDTDSE